MTRTSFLLAGLLTSLASVTFSPGSARADVVSPPPSGMCPDGTTVVNSHGLSPAACTPNKCSSDTDCTGGTVCAEQKFCSGGGDWVLDVCPNGDECTQNTPCTPLKVCLKNPPAPPAPPADPAETGSCSFDVAGQAGGDAWLGIAAAVGITAALRSRRRRNS